MILRSCILILLAGFFGSGCVFHHAATPKPAARQPVSAETAPEPIVTPDTSLSAKVVRYNSVGRFVVLSFPVGQMPETGQTFSIYHAGAKVGEVKITGPQRDTDTVADLTQGSAEEGDDVRQP